MPGIIIDRNLTYKSALKEYQLIITDDILQTGNGTYFFSLQSIKREDKRYGDLYSKFKRMRSLLLLVTHKKDNNESTYDEQQLVKEVYAYLQDVPEEDRGDMLTIFKLYDLLKRLK